MNGEKLIDALQFIDDDMIECVDILRNHPKQYKALWIKYVTVAACVALAIFCGFKYFGNNAPTQENSSGSTGQMEDAVDMNTIYGDTADKEQVDENQKVNDNSNLRDEASGSTGTISGSTGDVCHAATVYMEITEIGDNSFKGKVLKKAVVANKTHFEENQIITVIYNKNTNENLHTLLIEDLSVGEKVYVFYGEIEADTIYTPRIEYELF